MTADEGDHFAGVQQQGCDGVVTPCTYGPGQIGELNTNVTGLLATQRSNLPDINQTWLGLAGPGVRPAGLDATTWVDQTDIRPTILALLGLHDDYRHDGRALVEALDPRALPVSLREHQPTLVRLAQVYKQLNGSVGSFGSDTLTASTSALKSGSSSDDRSYQRVEGALQALGTDRDRVAGRMKAALDDAAFANRPISVPEALELIAQGKALLAAAHLLAVNA